VHIIGGNPQIKDDTEIIGSVKIYGGSPTVSGCNIHDCPTGVSVNGSSAMIAENELTNCRTGIFAKGMNGGTIKKNVIIGSVEAGINVSSTLSYASITDNYVDGNNTCAQGIKIEQFYGDVTRNTFTHNLTGMYVYGTTPDQVPAIYKNRIKDNIAFGLVNYGPSPYLVECYGDDWGGLTGAPSPMGTGNAIYPPDRVIICDYKGIHTGFKWAGAAAEPVNTASGAFEYSHSDLSLPGRGPALEVTRNYSSVRALDDFPLGHSWSLNYDSQLDEEYIYDETGNWQLARVSLHEGGAEKLFTPSGNSFTPEQGCYDSLARAGNNAFTLTRKDHSVLSFTKKAGQTDPSLITYRLTNIKDQNGNSTTLSYSGDHLDTVADPSGRNLSFTWEGNHITRIDDSTGRHIGYGYNGDGDLTSYTDANNNTTDYQYNPPHYLTKIIEPGNDVFLENHYNSLKRVDWQKDGKGVQTTFTYDLANRITSIGEPGHTQPRKHYYDENSRLTKDLSPEGNAAIYHYDQYGNRDQATDAENNTTYMTYDGRGNLLSATDAEGKPTSYTYENDNLKIMTDALSHTTTNGYDGNNNMIQTTYPSPMGFLAFTYWGSGNGQGQVKTSKNTRDDHTTSYEYDSHGNPSKVTAPMGRITTYGYDPAGLLSWSQDPLNHKTSWIHDSDGNVTEIRDPLAQTDPNAHHKVEFTYNPDNTLRTFTDANSNVTSYAYDGNNQLNMVTDPNGKVTTYSYDGTQNVSSIKDARPSHYETFLNHDNESRLTSVDDPSSDPPQSFTYWPDAALKAVNHPTGEVTTYNYFKNNLVSSITNKNSPLSYAFTYSLTNKVASVTDNAGKVNSYVYDTADRPTGATDHNNPVITNGFTITHALNDLSQITGISSPGLSDTRGYNNGGELQTLSIPGGVMGLTHYDDGTINTITTPEGSTRHYTYDATGFITSLTNHTASGTQSLTYTRDNNGNIRYTNGTETYRYDSLNRLAWWTASGALTTYDYDEVGNLRTISVNGTPTKIYTYNSANEITNTGFSYDANGNMISNGQKDYAYDSLNRLIQVKNHSTGSVIASYAYDYQGRRTSKTLGATTTYYHWDGNNLVAETNSSGATTATYTYDDGGDPLMMRRGGTSYYYQTNSHGDVVSMTDSSGHVLNTYSYDPWGTVFTQSETVSNPLRYSGYVYDSESGLYYVMARYYDPGLGRFLTRDALSLANLKDPASLNRYAYCSDNPVLYVDENGQQPAGGGFTASDASVNTSECKKNRVRIMTGRAIILEALRKMAQEALAQGTLGNSKDDTLSDQEDLLMVYFYHARQISKLKLAAKLFGTLGPLTTVITPGGIVWWGLKTGFKSLVNQGVY
jgi:RHS repeat-associated protein